MASRLRTNQISGCLERPSGAEARLGLRDLAARVNSCPSRDKQVREFFRGLLKGVLATFSMTQGALQCRP
jgi:hypothetical protein